MSVGVRTWTTSPRFLFVILLLLEICVAVSKARISIAAINSGKIEFSQVSKVTLDGTEIKYDTNISTEEGIRVGGAVIVGLGVG